MIRMNHIQKIYGEGAARVEALSDISLEILENEFVGLMGPSGSGKSTLMNIVGCLDTPTSGEYSFEEENIKELGPNRLAEIRNRKIGFIFQSFNLIPHASALENVELPLIFRGTPSRARRKIARELLERVGLAGRLHHKPGALSGGEMQRVAIARALVNNPRLILADEPTGNLDTKSGQEIIAIFRELWSQGHTLIIVTHNPAIARLARRIISLKDGKIVDGIR